MARGGGEESQEKFEMQIFVVWLKASLGNVQPGFRCAGLVVQERVRKFGFVCVLPLFVFGFFNIFSFFKTFLNLQYLI